MFRQKLIVYNKMKQKKKLQRIFWKQQRVKKINKNRALGNKWTTYVEHSKGNKLYQREEAITQFY